MAVLKPIGIDFGVKTFITLSDGQKIKLPAGLSKLEKQIRAKAAQYQKIKSKRKLSEHKSANLLLRLKRKGMLRSFLKKTAGKLLRQFDSIYVEDLNKTGLSGRSRMMPWKTFVLVLRRENRRYKRQIVLVPAKNTTRKCANCQSLERPLALWEREFCCSKCGNMDCRDVNAAKNVLQDGIGNESKAAVQRRNFQ